jgi:3-deoxy-alpha-D-manno-octulosonate 8-oxidase
MIDVALSLEPLWENAIGKDWKQTITREVLRALYEKM